MSNSEPFYIQLKSHREEQKISLDEISKRTKINVAFLESIENGNFEVLPKTYLRLFLKSYSIEIGAEPKKTIEDYEIYSYGKIKPKSEQNIIKKKTNNTNQTDTLFKFNFNRKKIFSTTISLIFIYLLFSFVSNLNKTIQSDPTNQTYKELKEPIETKINTSEQDANIIIQNFEEKLFNKSNLIGIDNIKLPINSPFNLDIKAKNNTRVHYRIETNQTTILDNNIVILKDSIISLEYTETIFFDVLNCNDIELSINNIRIDNRINCLNKSMLRASIDSTGAINASFYSN